MDKGEGGGQGSDSRIFTPMDSGAIFGLLPAAAANEKAVLLKQGPYWPTERWRVVSYKFCKAGCETS